MNGDPTSLDRLNDLVLPPEVSWLPLAAGWYLVITLALFAFLALSYRAFTQWKANAYRRAALRALTSANSAPAIAEVLRRTALATTPRHTVADMTNAAWVDWLAQHCPEPLPDPVRNLLSKGIYSPASNDDDVQALRTYATQWINHHPSPQQNGVSA